MKHPRGTLFTIPAHPGRTFQIRAGSDGIIIAQDVKDKGYRVEIRVEDWFTVTRQIPKP